ncbi:hypothetical protein [Sphingobacterium hotanense]|uniref:Uncharacterized protein n=1 Tax=Sphingobacterium hotanense TaxID=649196 RepID=A0ABT7NJJ9_9SPHI|nr:hypothetical protein [Sphingobacterium hotanense]MDM1047315.1 hypothetical protein [Sphingobacterium hotanense]
MNVNLIPYYSKSLLICVILVSIILTLTSLFYSFNPNGFQLSGIFLHILMLGMALLTAFKRVGFTIVHKRKDRDWKYQLELERTMDIVNNIRALDLVETKVDLNDYSRYLVFAKTKEDFLTNLSDLNKLISCYSDRLWIFIEFLDQRPIDQSQKAHLFQYVNKTLYPGVREVVQILVEFRKSNDSKELLHLYEKYLLEIYNTHLLQNSTSFSNWNEKIKQAFLEGVSSEDMKNFEISLSVLDVQLEWIQQADRGAFFYNVNTVA